MKKAIIYPILYGLLGVFSWTSLSADVTYEMKSSLSGIPFLKKFEMYQTTCVRQGEMCTFAEVEIEVPDTTIVTKSRFYMDADNRMLGLCNWEDSSCVNIALASLDQFLSGEFRQRMLDTLDRLIDQVDEYFRLDELSFQESDEQQTISGYKCRKLLFNMVGRLNPPIEQVPGDLKILMNGYSWVTTDFPEYPEYKKATNDIMSSLFTPEIQNLIEDVLVLVGVDESFIQTYLESWTYLYVQMAFNITLEVWSPDMDVASMSFNLRYNSILENLSFEKIPDAVFAKPSGFEQENLNLSELLKGLDQ